jgi:hypothetical protein
MPSIQGGLTFVAHLDKTTRPQFSAAGTTGLSTETVDADGTYQDWQTKLITDATANTARITPNGVLSEVASTNHALYSADMSNAAWVKSNMAVDSDSHIDPAGNANTTCELRATAGNATILQTVTIASAAFRYAVYLKRKTGSGNIDITIDNGGTWTTKTINSTSWTRVDVGKTAANPIFGIRIVTSGDEVLATFNQLEPQAAPTSYIPTTSASVTRGADDFVYDNTGDANVNAAAGTILCAVSIPSVETRSQYTFDARTATDGVALLSSGQRFRFRVESGGGAVADMSGDTDWSLTSPNVVACVWALNDFRLYLDGSLDATADTSGAAPAGMGDLALGKFRSNLLGNLGGTIQHLLIYNRALSAAEIGKVSSEIKHWAGVQ